MLLLKSSLAACSDGLCLGCWQVVETDLLVERKCRCGQSRRSSSEQTVLSDETLVAG